MSYTSVRSWLLEHALIEPALLEGAALDVLVAERLVDFGGVEAAYVAELARSPEEVDRLIAGIAVPETWLFRYPRSYDLLLEMFERRLASGASALRVVSIGCATGQEPYCIAMTALHAGWSPERIHIEAFDRNGEFLRAAEAGVYGASSIRTEIPAWAVSFMRRIGDRIEIEPAVRALVKFTRADVTDPACGGVFRGGGSFDAIFCRNLLIYLNGAARERLLDSMVAELAPEGLLFVGHAEQLMRGALPLRAVDAPQAFCLQRTESRSIAAEVAPPVRRSVARPLVPRVPSAERVAQFDRASTRPDAQQSSEVSIDRASGLADAGHGAMSEKMIREIIARQGPTARALELLGVIRMSLNDAAGAKRLFEQAVYLEPMRSASLLQLAMICERAGDAGPAAAYWDRARRASLAADEGGKP